VELHSSRVETWNNNPIWGRLRMAVEDMEGAGLNTEVRNTLLLLSYCAYRATSVYD
jgi:hypothetical protein